MREKTRRRSPIDRQIALRWMLDALEPQPSHEPYLAALKRFGLDLTELGETNPDYWPPVFDFIEKVDAALSVLGEGRRSRMLELAQRVQCLTPREHAFVLGVFIECMGVAGAETGDAQ